MKHASELIKDFESEQYNELLTDIYVDEHLLAYQNGRYIAALQEFWMRLPSLQRLPMTRSRLSQTDMISLQSTHPTSLL